MPATRLSALLQVVRALDLTIRVADPEDFVRQTMVLPCEEAETGIRVDFIFSNSPYEAEALSRVNRVRIGVSDVCYASLEDLIIHKLVAGRPRDVEDVRNVLVKNRGYDESYVRRWLAEFETVTGAPLRAKLSEVDGDIP